MSTPPPTSPTLDRDFLALRARLIDLAAGFDRIDRDTQTAKDDPRWRQLRRAIDVLASSETHRAERMQMHFSLAYDPAWHEKP